MVVDLESLVIDVAGADLAKLAPGVSGWLIRISHDPNDCPRGVIGPNGPWLEVLNPAFATGRFLFDLHPLMTEDPDELTIRKQWRAHLAERLEEWALSLGLGSR